MHVPLCRCAYADRSSCVAGTLSLDQKALLPLTKLVLTCPGSDLSTTAAEQRTATTGERTVLARDVNLGHTRNANLTNCGANMSKCPPSEDGKMDVHMLMGARILPGLSSVFLMYICSYLNKFW
jgi:hypothetical protein